MDNTGLIIESLQKIEGINAEQGILYCNGEEAYIEILRAYCDDWESGVIQADELYAEDDWKNYTITVHGLKSALFSIGVCNLSEMAKQLEYAGKENRTDYIREHHKEFADSYRTFFNALIKNEWICSMEEEDAEPTEEISDISSGRFDKIIADMEEAVFSFDTEVLIKYVEELEQFCYKGCALKNILAPVRRKIEMYDLISAVEMLASQKKEMDE